MEMHDNAITNITSNECESVKAMANSAAKIAFYNFKWQFITLVIHNTTILCGVNEFLRLYKKNAVVATDIFNPRFSQRTQQFVLFGNNLDDIFHLLTWMEIKKFDTTAKYLIICQSNKRKDCDEVDALEHLWHRRIMNVIFINDVFRNGTAGYYHEYSKECKNTPPIKVPNWDYCVGTNRSRYCAEKFPIPLLNMYGCNIIVSTFFQPPYMYINNGEPSGADGDLLRIIIAALNATLELRTPSRGDGWGNLDGNGSWVGSLGDLYYDLANLSMTSASVTQARFNAFELSTFYLTTNIVWITHPPEPEPPSYKLLRPFKADARIALAASFLLVVIIALLFKVKFFISVCHLMNSGRSPDSVTFLAWQMCMGQAITTNPMKTSVLYLILIWTWYCFLVRTFYQVHLINSLKTEKYAAQFLSIEDAIAAGYPFGGGPALKEYFTDSPVVFKNWEGRDSSEYKSLMLNLTHGKKYVLICNLAMVQKFLRTPGRKLHILPREAISTPIGIFMKRFSPFASALNQILKRLFEFGFPQMIFRNNTESNVREKSADENKPIKLIYFRGCYVILLIGWVLSFILFIIEIYLKRRIS